ncbi:hypothetical protein [Nonomuraea glycinis]|uniref:hypothetical protein n=1 Tax=Nonomuraea glycinis TaxID=2047744 RepID=UPI002E1065B6|nr:hypothetical protein OHA68_12355 [Nonomuraea glycinis]
MLTSVSVIGGGLTGLFAGVFLGRHGRRRRGRLLKAVLVFLGALAFPWTTAVPAFADGAFDGGDIHVAQTLGDRELTVVIRRVEPVPGPVYVDVVSHAGDPPGELALRLSQDGEQTGATTVRLGAQPGFHRAGALAVSGAGLWELAIDDGMRVATIPFVVPARVMSPWQNAAYGGFVGAGLLMMVTLVVAVRLRAAAALVPAAGTVAALAVAVTAVVLSWSVPPLPPPGAELDPTADNIAAPYAVAPSPTADTSRPPVNVVSDLRDGDLRLALTDSSTGHPADDLLVHDAAFVHLAVVSPAGRLWHLHPVRAGPGDYRVTFAAPETGRYAVAAEIARRGGGRQLLRTSIILDAAGGVAPATQNDTVDRRIAPAGSPSTLTARFGTQDLQPWLGMAGHMIVVGPVTGAVADAPIWAHVHSMLPSTRNQPDESVAAFGPDVPFTYTFPLPGRYLVWIQAERGYSVRTVPASVNVPEPGKASP